MTNELAHRASVTVSASPAQLYDMLSDITRMGEWSPTCRACWWDTGDGPRVGAWFTGHNKNPEREWETRSQVVAADPGREFAFAVGGSWVRWGYTFEAIDGGTEITESWELLPDGIARFHERFGDQAAAEIEKRRRSAHHDIPLTLAAIKEAAERSQAAGDAG